MNTSRVSRSWVEIKSLGPRNLWRSIFKVTRVLELSQSFCLLWIQQQQKSCHCDFGDHRTCFGSPTACPKSRCIPIVKDPVQRPDPSSTGSCSSMVAKLYPAHRQYPKTLHTGNGGKRTRMSQGQRSQVRINKVKSFLQVDFGHFAKCLLWV